MVVAGFAPAGNPHANGGLLLKDLHLPDFREYAAVVPMPGVPGILEARRLTKEVKEQRELADTAEASRFTELRILLEGELRKIEAQAVAANREFGARIDQSERGMRDKLAESTGSLSAYLGEIEDKLDRALVPLLAPNTTPQAQR